MLKPNQETLIRSEVNRMIVCLVTTEGIGLAETLAVAHAQLVVEIAASFGGAVAAETSRLAVAYVEGLPPVLAVAPSMGAMN